MQEKQERRAVIRGQGVRALVAVTAVLIGVCTSSLAQVSVSSGGTPSYGVNIGVPPGIAGMSPNLSLVYTGGGVNGPVGYGWTLTGVSLITRCPGNKATDGTPIAVTYAPADRLCLDGQRLIQTSTGGVPTASTPAANGALLDANGRAEDGSYTEYRTEKDIYSRIRAYGMANGVAANGPRYFKVWTKAGQAYEYGAGPSMDANSNSLITPAGGTIVAAWAVSRVSDTVGNFIDFKYSYRNIAWGSGPTAGPTTGHEWNLAEIQYTGNGSQVATNKVVFEYEDRPDTPGAVQDRAEAYHRSYKNVSIERLKAVRTYINWPSTTLGVTMPSGALVAPPSTAVKVKTLKIGYELGPVSGRSRVITTQECAGTAETSCLPKTKVVYATAPASDAYVAKSSFSGGALSTLQLTNAAGTMGVLLGDFNGDGKTDIIRWSDTSSQNVMYTSNGDGSFAPASTFNLPGVQLFKSDGCYASIAMDFNGDGLVDILRVMQPTSSSGASCGTPVNLLYLSKGDGTFAAAITVPSSISFQQTVSVLTSKSACEGTVCSSLSWTQTAGANYHIMDVNGDGLPDIVTTIVPAYKDEAYRQTPDSLCQAITCTQVFAASFNGMTAGPNAVPSVSFAPIATNMTNHSVYGPPRPLAQWSPRFHPYVADFDGDGFLDLQVDSGGWRSLGNGSFQLTPTNYGCQYPIDFNGDGRADCLLLISPMSANYMTVGNGADVNTVVAGFNLAGAGVLTPTTSPVTVGTAVGIVLADLDGDGRVDIIRWKDDPTQNMAYLSNGDGTFRTSDLLSNLSSTTSPLQKSDGSVSFLTGDFTGNGQTEILRMVSTITAGSPSTTNQLFVRPSAALPEELGSITPPSGLTSTVTFASLLNSSSPLGPRYTPGRQSGSAAVYPKIDISVPLRVIQTVETASGVGSLTTKDEYAYGALRATSDGHGFLGFQMVSEQHSAADGSPLTTVTSYLQDGAYIGLAGTSKTLDGALNATSAPIISRTTNSYCDTTSTASGVAVTTPGTAPTPCATTSLVQRRYMYQSVEEGWDIDSNRTALPTVTTTYAFNDSGEAAQVSVSTTGTALGLSQMVAKVTANSFQPDNTSSDNWILGRLQQSTQTNTVPNSLASIATSAGTAKYATATTGETLGASLTVPVFPTTYVGQTSTVNATLQNTSSGPLGVTVPTASSVTGTDFSFVSTSCTSTLAQGASCTVTIKFAPTVAVTRTGTVTINNEANHSSAALSGAGVPAPPALTLSNCVSTTPTTAPAAATMVCQVGNTGQTAASSIAYASSVSGVTASGPSTCAASTSNCGAATVTTPTSAGAYAGNLTLTPSSGVGTSASFSLVVDTPAALSLTACSSVSPTVGTTAASMSCTVDNSGQTAASGIVYSSTNASMTLTAGPTTCAANTGNCGTVKVTSPASPGTYAGNLVATPASGAQASAAFSLTVYTVPALTLSGCSSNSGVTTPSQASMTCTVGNTGQAGATGIAYASTNGSMTISGGPTSCAGGSTCGTVTITSPGTAGAYSGTLSATPASGTAASASFGLQVNTAAQLTLSACSTNTNVVTPSQATQTCTLGNSGQTSATGIVYGVSPSGMAVSGPTSCAASSGNCGNVTVTTPTAANTYSGTFTATPASGGAASSSFALVVLGQPVLTLTGCSSVTAQTPPAQSTFTCTVGNSGPSAANGMSYSTNVSGVSISGGPSSCSASNANCGSVVVSAPAVAGTYAGALTVTPALGSGASASFSLHENSLASLAFTNCSTVSPATSPAQASTTCTLLNNGDNASGVILAAVSPTQPAGVALSGSGNTCAGNSTCGTWAMTTSNGGTYSGTVTASLGSGMGTGASFTFNLTENAPVVTAFALVSSTGLSSTFQNNNASAVTVTSSGVSGGTSFAVVTTNTCTGSIAAGGRCTITFTAQNPDCPADNYTASAFVQDSGGYQYGQSVSRQVSSGVCR